MGSMSKYSSDSGRGVNDEPDVGFILLHRIIAFLNVYVMDAMERRPAGPK